MRRGLAIEAEPGVVASSPGEALAALVALAEADGADRDDWLGKALAHAGASRASVVVRGDPRYRVIEEAAGRADHVFRVVLASAQKEIVALLEARAAAVPADPSAPGA